MAEWAQWDEWRARCARDRCAPETRRELTDFAARRFAGYWRRWDRRRPSAARIMPPDAETCWARFESHLALKNTRAGKSYKQWIFARTDRIGLPPAQVVESGVTLILRSVVRTFLREEAPRDNTASLNAPLSGETEGWTLADLLPDDHAPDPAGEAAEREEAALAAEFAEDCWRELAPADRIALAARSTRHPEDLARLLQRARCPRSTYYLHYQHALKHIARRARERFARETPAVQSRIAILAAARLRRRATEKFLLDSRRARGFKGMTTDCAVAEPRSDRPAGWRNT